jgi:hypothetical protein
MSFAKISPIVAFLTKVAPFLLILIMERLQSNTGLITCCELLGETNSVIGTFKKCLVGHPNWGVDRRVTCVALNDSDFGGELPL